MIDATMPINESLRVYEGFAIVKALAKPLDESGANRMVYQS
jgi:hypothetical protein